VIAFEKQARLSKILATIILDAPIDLNEEALVYEDANEEKVIEVFFGIGIQNIIEQSNKES
jgi:DNA polymerase I